MPNTPDNKSLLRGVTVLDSKRWASCPEALWDPTARPKPNDDGHVARLHFGRTANLATVFSTAYDVDAHCAAYIVVDPSGAVVPRTPRLNKQGLAEMRERGYRVLFGTRWADLDEPDHGALTDERWARYEAILRDYPCAYYRTRGGVRVIQSLTTLLTPEQYEVCVRRWLGELRTLLASVDGVVVDPQCCDWPRLMRLPRVVRDDDVKLDLRATVVHTENIVQVSPGDCTPPVKIVAPPRPPVVANGDTRYGLAALERACTTIETSRAGARHKLVFSTAAGIGSLVSGGELQDGTARAALEYAIRHLDEHERALSDGYAKGLETPRSAPRRTNHFDLNALKAQFKARVQLDVDDNGDVAL